jgi:polyferredoxin
MNANMIHIYILGFAVATCVIFGRFIICKICPFAFLQDWLFKIPFPFKRKSLKGDRYLRWIKFVLLGWMIISGLINGFERGDAESGMSTARIVSFAVFIILFIILQHPLCKYLCPCGALFALFNLISLYRYRVDMDKCTKCGRCTKKCKMDIAVYKSPNQPECVRCKDCIKVCSFKAIKTEYGVSKTKVD